MLPILYIFNYPVEAYELMTQLAVSVSIIYLFIAFRKLNIRFDEIVLFLLVAVFVQYFGGTLIPLLYRWIYLHQDPWKRIIMEKSPGRFFHSVVLSMIAYSIFYSGNFLLVPLLLI